ncbi:MAG TPA: NAD(P)/FAD-dependent oxidoreductase [Terracidiphilus sp.]|nr:NAD(P)/FAD-dependent oxidoreductase [Terracidiphilus sp.]
MNGNGRRVVIIGGGIAGLSTAVYALQCGYEAVVLEMGETPGGLAMSWGRGPYTFETCLHWFVGSKPDGELNGIWREVLDIDRLKFIDHEEFVRIETEHGDCLHVWTNAGRLEEELLRRSPQDGKAIRQLTHTIRTLSHFHLLDPAGGLADNWLNIVRDLPIFPVLGRLGRMSGREYGNRFSDPLLKSFFSEGDVGRLTAVAMVLSLAWMHVGNAGYCIGGAQAIIRAIEERIRVLGGEVRCRAKVQRVLVESDMAVGVELAGGERVMGDWVISAADGHATIFDMLDGRYARGFTRQIYDERETFASYVQVSLGVGMDLTDQPPMLTRILDSPINLDPATDLRNVGFRFFHYDPTFAPVGKCAVTCLMSTRNYAYWSELRTRDPRAYHAEKHRIAEAVIEVLDRRVAGLRDAVETVDVSTPASVMRHTGNWKGSMEGWLLEPGQGFRPLPNTLPGLKRFLMVGQWVMPGGGLPSGPMTARPAVKAMCRQDEVPFVLRPATQEREVPAVV